MPYEVNFEIPTLGEIATRLRRRFCRHQRQKMTVRQGLMVTDDGAWHGAFEVTECAKCGAELGVREIVK